MSNSKRTKAKDGKKAKPKQQDRIERELKLLSGDNDKGKTARALLRIPPETWSGYQYVPPGSILETIIREFERKSHAPLEIPLFVTLQLLATIMLQKNVNIRIKGIESPVIPMLWIFLLADSGSMKSMAFREILRWSGLDKDDLLWDLNPIAGPAAFAKELCGTEATEDCPATPSMNRRLAIIDEVSEFRKKMKGQGPLAELPSYFLMLYDHDAIGRKTSRKNMGIKEPAVNLLGFAVPEPFFEGITAEEMISGYMQRHTIIIGESRKKELPGFIKLRLKRTGKEWQRLLESVTHTEYHIGTVAQKAFLRAHRRLLRERGELPDSFLLRIMWTSHTYALLYHVLLGHGREPEICTQAYGYAERLVRRSLADMGKAFAMTLHSDTFRKIRKIEEYRDKLGRLPTAREVYRNIRDVKPREAEYLLSIIAKPAAVIAKIDTKPRCR